MPHPRLLTVEKQLALAHRVLWEAQETAELIGLHGTAEDLFELLRELERIHVAAMTNSRGSRTALRNPK